MSPPMTGRHGRWLIVVAAVLWSTSGFFVKAPVFADWPEGERGVLFSFWRAVFAAAVLLPFVRQPRWRSGLVPMSLSFLMMNVAFLSAMTLTTEANATWLQNTAPAWVLLCAVMFLGERVVSRDWVMFALAMLGVSVILGFEFRQAVSAGGLGGCGVGLGLLGGVCYAGVILSLRYLRSENAAGLVALNHLVTAAALAPLVVWWGVWPNGEQLVYLAAFGILQMGVPYVIFARGLRSVSGHEAASLALLEPLLVPVWVFLAWGNSPLYVPPAWWTFLGAGLIFSGLLLRYAGVRRT